MLHVCSSNSLERLAGALAHRLSSRASEGASLLEPEWIIVPNGNVATYARLQIARRNGVAANLALDHWEALLERLLELRGEPRWRLLHRRAVTVLLAALLADAGELERIGAEALQRYVRPGGSGPGERDLHTYQLAARLAGMFEEYHLSRPELIQAWLEGKTTLTGPEAATELWQSALWRRLFAPGGVRDELTGAGRWVLPAEVVGALPPADRLPPRLHVFGFSYMPRGTLALLRVLADATDVTLYTFAPVRPPVEQGDDLHLALKMWGRPGLEFMQMLEALKPEQQEQLFTADPPPPTKKKKRAPTELPDGSVQLTLFAPPPASGSPSPAPAAPTATSLLGTLQHDIERGRKPASITTPPADPSLTVLACPSLQREVEIVAGKIWTLLRDVPLRFNDIALIVADTARFDEYTSHIRAVFQDLYNIPTSISDAKPTSQHRVLEAIELLLALPDGQFRRPELLRLLTQPALLARFHRTDAEDWKSWCERTAIWFGADRSDLAGLYVDKDLLSWDQGLKRLALGAFLAPEPDGDAAIFELEGQRYVPEPLRSDELPSAALLSTLVRALVAEARFARDARLPLAEWSRHFTRLVATYLAPADADDEMLLARARRELGRLAELDLSGRPVPARIAAEIAREALGRIPGGRGHYLADGVVVSSLQPMRPIPFPVAFIVGLGEGRFPGAEGLDALDLRRAQRVEGDVTVRERDQYLFLEALVSTSKRLYLSYVSRDAQTGEESNPSSALEELGWMLQQHHGIASPVERHPLRRWDEDPAAKRVVLSPRARREAVLRGLDRRELNGLSRRQRVELLRRDPAAAASWLGLIPLPEPAERTGAARMELPITAVRRFLECPLQGWARAVLGLVEEDTRDVVSCEDEPLACDRLPAAILLSEVFRALMAQGAEEVTSAALDAAFARVADRAELAGTLPAGAFGHSERLRLRGILEAWRVRFSWANLTGPVEPVCFGRADEGAHVRAIEPPLVLDLTGPAGKPLQVVLFGQTQPVNEEATVSIKLVMRDHASAADHLGAWIDHVVLAAGGLGGGEGLTSTVIGAPSLNKTQTFAPLTRDAARTYLTALVGEMLWTSHAYFMPIEAVEDFHKNGGDLADVAEELRQGSHRTVRSDHGPVPHPRSYEPPAEHEGRAMLRRRLAPFLGALTVEEAMAEEPEE